MSVLLIEKFLHLDTYLQAVIGQYGLLIYALIFLIIFMETGVVITPFLPGDSLLFAAGAIAASTSALNIWVLFITISAAAIIGDAVNYSVGRYLGARAFAKENSKIFKKEYLEKTEEFYKIHGNKAIVLGRFIPIIRTFIPFIAGVGKMDYDKFAFYNVLGGVVWTAIFLSGGYLFGNIKIVKDNFEVVILGIIFLSLIPALYHIVAARYKKTP